MTWSSLFTSADCWALTLKNYSGQLAKAFSESFRTTLVLRGRAHCIDLRTPEAARLLKSETSIDRCEAGIERGESIAMRHRRPVIDAQ